MPARVRLGEGDQPQLGDEPVVVGGELAVHATVEGVGPQDVGQPSTGILAPPVTLLEPGKGTGRDQLAARFRHRMVVGRRSPAGEGGQEALVPPDLTQRPRVVLEQGDRTAPAVQQPTDPRPADQPHAELDPAGPVDPREERVGSPPGPQLSGHHLGVPVVTGQPEGAGQHGQVVMARELPDRLDVARDGLVPVVDGEAQLVLWCSPSGDGVQNQSGSRTSTRSIPSTDQRPSSRASAARMTAVAASSCAPGSAHGREASARTGDPRRWVVRHPSCRPARASSPRRAVGRGRGRDPATSAADMRLSRRAYQTGLRVTGTPHPPVDRLSRAFRVARVVAISEGIEMGIAVAVPHCRDELLEHPRWPLS